MGAESFTVLAILEAQDRASEIFGKIDESLDRFSDTAKKAADTAKVAGDEIDDSLLKTASGADALDLADARVSAATLRLAAAQREQADAEKALLDAQAASAEAGEADAGAAGRQVAAADALTAAQKREAVAARQLSEAQKLQSDTAEAAAAKNDEAGDAAAGSGLKFGSMGKVAGIAALGMGIAGAVMVKAAGNFQDSTTHLVTDAGESAKNLQMVQAGILSVSTATGQSASSITDAMYHIESGGMHGASGLAVLKIAAEGARVGGADLDTVSKTLVGTLNAYGMTSSNAGKQTKMSTSLMNQLITTVGAGDMRMQDLASSLSSVAPLAASAGISFAQVGGAVATMTAQGMTAQQATQDLSHSILALKSPNNVAVQEMQSLGLSSQDVAQHLGQRGLTGTLGILTEAITRHMGPSGLVIQSAFESAKVAAADANTEIQAMPPSLQNLAKGFLDGSISSKAWRTDLQGLSPVQAHLMTQFAGTAEKTHSFNDLLAKGGPAAQTYTAALAKMMGGTTGLKTALMLTGPHAATFRANVDKIAASAKHAGGNVDDWGKIQSTFNFKMDSAKTAVANTGIAIGSALLPAATAILQTIVKIITPIAEWTAKHKGLTEAIFGGGLVLAATIAIIAGARKAYSAITGALGTVKKALQAVGLMSKETAATQKAAAEDAAGAEEASAEESAAAQEEAAAESSSSWLAAAASTVGGWIAAGATMIASAAGWVIENIAKVAVVVGTNLAGAASSAAAWLIANAAMTAGIALVVVAVAAAIYEIVKHWRDIEKAAKAVWRDILSFVKSWWPLLLAVVTGGLSLLVGLVLKYHAQIFGAIEDAWNDVKSFVSGIVGDVVDFVKSHWRLLISIIGGPLGLVVALVTKYWSDIKRWFSDGVHAVEAVLSWFGSLPGRFTSWLSGALSAVERIGGEILSWFEGLPGRVVTELSRLGGDLLSIGYNAMMGLWHGIERVAGDVVGYVEHIASNISGAFKSVLSILSPSKVFQSHGAMIMQGLLAGLQAGEGAVIGQISGLGRKLAGPALTASIGGGLPALSGGGGGGSTSITIDLRGAQVMSQRDLDQLVTKVGNAVATRIAPQAGLKFRMG